MGLQLTSSNEALNAGFKWAQQMALTYVHDSDPVGPWYEASLPGREAFCMRDVAHQSMGASLLGLNKHNKNMLYRFAENITEGKDWCTFWEINRYNKPVEEDYQSDDKFWYNLPANFDVLDCCLRQYLWTGDEDYLKDPVFLNFYDRTVTDYVKHWDKNGDGLIEHYKSYGVRGIGSYVEDGLPAMMAGDLVAAQYAGFRAYARIQQLIGNYEALKLYAAKALQIQQKYEQEWWDEGNQRFYGAMLNDGTFYANYYLSGHFLPLYYGIIEDRVKHEYALQEVVENGASNVEELSYLPEIFFRGGLWETGFETMLQLMSPDLKRREYPEVSYSAINSIVTGLIGIGADAADRVIMISPRLPDQLDWIEASEIPVFKNLVNVYADQRGKIKVVNVSGPSFNLQLPNQKPFVLAEGQQIIVEG